MARAECPECGERVKIREDGKRLRCPECGEKFFPPDEDGDEEEEERPRRRRRRRPAASNSSGTKIAAIVVGSLLALGLIALAVVLIARKGGGDATAAVDRSKVTVDNFKSVKPGMDLAEVEAILGGSRSSSEDDMRDAIRKASGGLKGEFEAGFAVGFAQMGEGTNWRRWEGNNLRAWVAFARTKDGQRAAFSTAIEENGGGYNRVDGFVTFAGNHDLDRMNEDRKKEDAFRNDAKWVRGAKAREWVLGEWRDETTNGYLFGQAGKLTELNGFPAFQGREPTYRVVDDRFLEIITPSPFAPLPGQAPVHPAWVNTSPTVQRYEYLVNQDELALIDAAPQAVAGIRSYYRFPVRAGSLAETKIVAPLIADLKGPDPNKRALASHKLRQLAKSIVAVLPMLTELFRNPDATVADSVVWIIYDLKDLAAPVVPTLTEMLRDANPKCVMKAVTALGYIGPAAKEALPALRELARSARTQQLRFEADQSIHRIETGKF